MYHGILKDTKRQECHFSRIAGKRYNISQRKRIYPVFIQDVIDYVKMGHRCRKKPVSRRLCYALGTQQYDEACHCSLLKTEEYSKPMKKTPTTVTLPGIT